MGSAWAGPAQTTPATTSGPLIAATLTNRPERLCAAMVPLLYSVRPNRNAHILKQIRQMRQRSDEDPRGGSTRRSRVPPGTTANLGYMSALKHYLGEYLPHWGSGQPTSPHPYEGFSATE